MKQANDRDYWDKLEIIIKFFNGIVITLLTIFIGYGAQKVADSFKYGELTQKLLGDLSMQDANNKVKRDLSIITLNRTIGDEKHQMIADMAEVICKSDSSTLKEKTVAFNILKERDSSRAKQLEDAFNRNRLVNLADSFIRKNSISLPNANPLDSNPNPRIHNPIIAENIKQIGSTNTTVFIQTNKNRENLSTISSMLSKHAYLVPGIEEIDKKFKNSVRYFNPEDAGTALTIAKKIEQSDANWKCDIQQFKNPQNKIPPGQIEVWIYQD